MGRFLTGREATNSFGVAIGSDAGVLVSHFTSGIRENRLEVTDRGHPAFRVSPSNLSCACAVLVLRMCSGIPRPPLPPLPSTPHPRS